MCMFVFVLFCFVTTSNLPKQWASCYAFGIVENHQWNDVLNGPFAKFGPMQQKLLDLKWIGK
jgi:hypothetical protein